MTDAQTLAFILGLIPIIGLAAVYLIHLIRHGNVDDNHSQQGGQVAQLRVKSWPMFARSAMPYGGS